MSSYVFNYFKTAILDDGLTNGSVFKENDTNTSATFVIELVRRKNGVFPDFKNISMFNSDWSISSGSSSASGYELANHVNYAPKRLYVDLINTGASVSTKNVLFKDVSTSSTNIIWSGSTIDAAGAVIYKEGPINGTTGINVLAIDFGGVKSSTDGNFQLVQDVTKGFLQLQ